MADIGLFAWLCRASICGDADVERAAEVMKDYYQGVGAEPEYQEQAALASRPAEVADLLPPLGIRNDRDMLNYLMTAFDNEIANCERCGHAEPTKNMDSASFLRDYLGAAPSAPGTPADRFHWSKRGMELDPNGYYVAYSAPGIPEAPADMGEPTMLWDADDPEDGTHGDNPQDFAESYVCNSGIDEPVEVEVLCAYRGGKRTMLITPSEDGKTSWSWVQRAAQLDGGQGEEASHA